MSYPDLLKQRQIKRYRGNQAEIDESLRLARGYLDVAARTENRDGAFVISMRPQLRFCALSWEMNQLKS